MFNICNWCRKIIPDKDTKYIFQDKKCYCSKKCYMEKFRYFDKMEKKYKDIL